MNQNYQGDAGTSAPAGSVKRARERVQAGLPRESLPLRQLPTNPEPRRDDYSASTSRLPVAAASGPARLTKPRPQPAGDGRAGRSISRPMHAPQWPLPGPAASPISPRSEPVYSPSARAPRRPPRPSNVPSILDESGPPEPGPHFAGRSNAPQSPDVGSDGGYDALSPAVASSRQTTSSIGTIPDFPVPAPTPATAPSGAAAKKSSTLGPPPSARRGASSFYSTTSFVSPIPEESPRSRSHGSYASSAAMPEAWDRISPISGSPPYGDAFFDDSLTDRESTHEEFGDESKLVRSASIGKKGKPAIVMNRTGSGRKLGDARPAPSPVQPFNGGTGYVDTSTGSSRSFPTAKQSPDTTPATTNQTGLAPDLGPSVTGGAAEAVDTSRPPNRLSNMRRPPRLDMDAVRAAEARGSLTSLPDLIRRATRLASMIDKGKRPGSRMDDLTFFGEKGPMRNGDGSLSADERHQSGLSDMLAAFPPPVHTPRGNRRSNASWFRPSSWPAVADQSARGHSRASSVVGDDDGAKKQRRRCCGLPLWAFILVVFLLLCLVVAAIVVPLEFFVFKNLGNHPDEKDALANCQSSLTCLNAGTNVVSQGVCSCICTNGFTGSNCGQSGSMGCTTTNLVATDGSASINNVTLGRAIPRLISQGNANFSLPLSGTIVLAKLNTANLSCIAQNSLVTFDGFSTRGGEANDEVTDASDKAARAVVKRDGRFPPISIITYVPRATTVVLTGRHLDQRPTPEPQSTAPPPVLIIDTSSYAPPSASKPTTTSTTTRTGTSTRASPTSSPTSTPTGLFTVTEEVVDFARVAMLYILQEESVNAAETAQTGMQALFSRASSSKTRLNDQVTEKEAKKVAIGGDNTINLVDFTVDVGKGPIGRKNINRSSERVVGASTSGSGRRRDMQ
ncbi:hypothetical protein JDV02_009908 [Purpureocillium takamizusanense]|uniref:EGF-like domain-containing protein n=1 Tax=Purpureocillium takamizusanense TaxID=2060973 RepID=A0A9Q8QQY0_9HYPO|nr:uncharacterized protein JDV02_009908 [Purpureocillium takamizusanense]UNI24135.1 hypothetical protein JDV02_009908 [Purpureocillium takamizusanense]